MLWEETKQLKEIRNMNKLGYLGILAQLLYNYLTVDFYCTHIESWMYLTQFIDTANLYVGLEYRKADASTVVAYYLCEGVGYKQ